jgi:hypothetical protein
MELAQQQHGDNMIETSPHLIESLHAAREMALRAQAAEVLQAHLIMAMLSDDESSFLLEAYGVDFDKLRKRLEKIAREHISPQSSGRQAVFSQAIEIIMSHAREQASRNALAEVDSNLVLAVMISEKNGYLGKMLLPYDLDVSGVLQYLELREGKTIAIDDLPPLPKPPKTPPQAKKGAASSPKAGDGAPPRPQSPASSDKQNGGENGGASGADGAGVRGRSENNIGGGAHAHEKSAPKINGRPAAGPAARPMAAPRAIPEDGTTAKNIVPAPTPEDNKNASGAQRRNNIPRPGAIIGQPAAGANAANSPGPSSKPLPAPGSAPGPSPDGAKANNAHAAGAVKPPSRAPDATGANMNKSGGAKATMGEALRAQIQPKLTPAHQPAGSPGAGIKAKGHKDDEAISRLMAQAQNENARPPSTAADAALPARKLPNRPARRRRAEPGGIGVRESLSATGSVLEKGRLIETIPRRMAVRKASRAEVRITRAQMDEIASEFENLSASHVHELAVTEAMTVQLRAPGGSFHIENLSPQTQWIDRNQRHVDDADFGVWRWNVTPVRAGKARLQLVVSARTVDEHGAIHIADIPDKIIDININRDYGRSLKRAGLLTAVLLSGVIIGKFGQSAYNWIAGVIGGIGGIGGIG